MNYKLNQSFNKYELRSTNTLWSSDRRTVFCAGSAVGLFDLERVRAPLVP